MGQGRRESTPWKAVSKGRIFFLCNVFSKSIGEPRISSMNTAQKISLGTSLVVQWIRIGLLMQGTQFRSWVQ